MNQIFASNNLHKLKEVSAILHGVVTVKSPHEAGITEDIAETADTLEGNAFIKADYVYQKTKQDCFADDTGLFVDALNGMPGVISARFAGEHCSPQENIEKLLSLMQKENNRKANFKTVICLIQNGKGKYFEGVIKGSISRVPAGANGFGYDPVFIPDGFPKTFAELSAEEKNSLSHRAIAVGKMKEWLVKNG
jgi:XTP/dITP diphosphohydrolase